MSFSYVIHLDNGEIQVPIVSMGNELLIITEILPPASMGSELLIPTEIIPSTSFGSELLFASENIPPVSLGDGFLTDADSIFGVILFMSNLIQSANQSSLQVTDLTVADVAGTGQAVLSPPNGVSYKLRGFSLQLLNHPSDFAVDLHESFYLHTNTGAGTTICALPSGAPNGTCVAVMRTGGQIILRPVSNDRIFLPTSGFLNDGQDMKLQSSGCCVILVANDNADWLPFAPHGVFSV